jgi:hypothetical protein
MQNVEGSSLRTRQHASRTGLSHWKKSSSQTAGGSVMKDESGRLRSASRTLAIDFGAQVEKRPQSSCWPRRDEVLRPRSTK